ncbi:MAG: DUF1015 domain-containing protein [Spirochaeta sp.]|nr:DUF1015 domain-containing protein [Spirochaeta sp.]
MDSIEQRMASLGIAIPEILLPNSSINLERWAVIACDQHTASRDYWNQVESFVGEKPSTLQLVFPEIYLNDSDKDHRIATIKNTMTRYLEDGVFAEPSATAVYLERDTGRVTPRRGLILSFDLEQYDYSPDSDSLIRATEGTILDRIPPRMDIRRGAPLESPHIMVLVDDPEHSVMAPWRETPTTPGRELLYETQLMSGGGHIKGYRVGEAELRSVIDALEALQAPERLAQRYGAGGRLLFAMGDGNHSLATAKAIWEELKNKGADPEMHPARWALAELVNLHDPALIFEPIHRVMLGMDVGRFLNAVRSCPDWEYEPTTSTLRNPPETAPEGSILMLSQTDSGILRLKDKGRLAAATAQEFLDSFSSDAAIGEQPEVDYIHGSATVASQVQQHNAVGLILPEFDKNGLFRTVAREGTLPRKSFSMGVAAEKRYYLECRKILT